MDANGSACARWLAHDADADADRDGAKRPIPTVKVIVVARDQFAGRGSCTLLRPVPLVLRFGQIFKQRQDRCQCPVRGFLHWDVSDVVKDRDARLWELA